MIVIIICLLIWSISSLRRNSCQLSSGRQKKVYNKRRKRCLLHHLRRRRNDRSKATTTHKTGKQDVTKDHPCSRTVATREWKRKDEKKKIANTLRAVSGLRRTHHRASFAESSSHWTLFTMQCWFTDTWRHGANAHCTTGLQRRRRRRRLIALRDLLTLAWPSVTFVDDGAAGFGQKRSRRRTLTVLYPYMCCICAKPWKPMQGRCYASKHEKAVAFLFCRAGCRLKFT